MNGDFKSLLSLPEQDRRDVFEATASRLDTLPGYVEKDFWVCLVLGVVFNRLPKGHPRLLFKGRTSLSKAFGLIARFSDHRFGRRDADPASGRQLQPRCQHQFRAGQRRFTAGLRWRQRPASPTVARIGRCGRPQRRRSYRFRQYPDRDLRSRDRTRVFPIRLSNPFASLPVFC